MESDYIKDNMNILKLTKEVNYYGMLMMRT